MGNCVYWCMLCLSNEVFNNALPMDSWTIQFYSLLWCSEPLVYLIITFCQYPVLNRGTYVKGQGLYPLGHCDWRLDGAFRIFHFWVLTFRYHKGTPMIRDRFESCYLHHCQLRRNSHAHTHKHSPNHVWWQSQSQAQAQARYLTIYNCLTLATIFDDFTWMH